MIKINIALFILYYILISIFTKFSAFKNRRKNIGFRGTFLLVLITTIIFIVNCYYILYDPTFIFGIYTESKVIRITFLLFFITTFFTIFGFLLADYFRQESDNKDIIQGFKGISGPRGNRGEDKKISTCDENLCSERICNKKIMQIISDAYNHLLKKKEVYPVPNGSQIENKFIINKVNLLCQSQQFLNLNEEKNENEIYGSPIGTDSSNKNILSEEDIYGDNPKDDGMIRSTWVKWLKIILKYEKGLEFLESEDLVDNDFDNMITENDKLFVENFNSLITPGTPSQGKESPFDEIKKFDMWYWGEKQESTINVQFHCENKNINNPDYKPVLYELDSNQYKNVWRSKIGFQQVTDNSNFIPFLNKGSKPISIYRPEVIETDQGIYKPLGDIALNCDIDSNNVLGCDNHKDKNSADDVFPRNKIDMNFIPNQEGDPSFKTKIIAGDIKSPDLFKPMYKSKRKKGIGINKYGYSFWKPQVINKKDELEYKCLGYVIDNGVTLTPPNKNMFACVPKKCVRRIKSPLESNYWNSTPERDEDQILPSNKEQSIFTKRNSKNKLFYIEEDLIETDESDGIYELIPKGENGDNGETSCFDNMLSNSFEESKWIVEPKNNPDYSIHSHFNNSEWKSKDE